jgi:hypothetical protein
MLMALALGSIWWYFVTGIIVIFLIIFIEKENLFACLINTVIYMIFLQWVSHINIIGWSIDHPFKLLLYILGYFVIGILWSFVKWWFRVSERVDNHIKEKTNIRVNYLKKRLFTEAVTIDTAIPVNLKDDWIRHQSCCNYIPEKASEHKNLIATWITYWPFSLLWSLLHDFIKQVMKKIVTMLQGVYDGITHKIEKNLKEDK